MARLTVFQLKAVFIGCREHKMYVCSKNIPEPRIMGFGRVYNVPIGDYMWNICVDNLIGGYKGKARCHYTCSDLIVIPWYPCHTCKGPSIIKFAIGSFFKPRVRLRRGRGSGKDVAKGVGRANHEVLLTKSGVKSEIRQKRWMSMYPKKAYTTTKANAKKHASARSQLLCSTISAEYLHPTRQSFGEQQNEWCAE